MMFKINLLIFKENPLKKTKQKTKKQTKKKKGRKKKKPNQVPTTVLSAASVRCESSFHPIIIIIFSSLAPFNVWFTLLVDDTWEDYSLYIQRHWAECMTWVYFYRLDEIDALD